MLRRTFIFALTLCAFGAVSICGQSTLQAESDRLATLLKWNTGSVVAEIGAGNGNLTLAAAHRVGPTGKIYTNEIDPKALTHLEELAGKEKNITAVKGAEEDTNLSAECCDSIFMRLVYHHLTRPLQIDQSLLRSLKPGGRLAVIDEEPQKGSSVPQGVPENRGGHGVPQKILIDELKSAGFKVETVLNDWPGGDEFHQMYCVVFLKNKP